MLYVLVLAAIVALCLIAALKTGAAPEKPTTKNIEIHMFSYKDEEEDPRIGGRTIHPIGWNTWYMNGIR